MFRDIPLEIIYHVIFPFLDNRLVRFINRYCLNSTNMVLNLSHIGISDKEKITGLKIPNRNYDNNDTISIENFTGLKYLKILHNSHLNDNFMNEIPIKQITTFITYKIVDLSGLSNCEYLGLMCKWLDPIPKIPIKTLILYEANLDISNVAETVTTLHLDNVNITNYVIKKFVNVKTLNLRYIDNFLYLGNMTKCENLTLFGCEKIRN